MKWKMGDRSVESERKGVWNWDLSTVVSHFKDRSLPADSLGLFFILHLIYRIWATLQTWGGRCHGTHLRNVISTFRLFHISKYWSTNLRYLFFTWLFSSNATLYLYSTTFYKEILYFFTPLHLFDSFNFTS